MCSNNPKVSITIDSLISGLKIEIPQCDHDNCEEVYLESLEPVEEELHEAVTIAVALLRDNLLKATKPSTDTLPFGHTRMQKEILQQQKEQRDRALRIERYFKAFHKEASSDHNWITKPYVPKK